MLCVSAIILCLVPREVNAQSGIGPSVEWRDIMVPTFTSPWGKHYSWDQGLMNYVPSQVTSSTPITPATSGEDWWYAHCNLYDGSNNLIGYAAAGYNTIPNWGYEDQTGCFKAKIENVPGVTEDPKPQEFETWQHRKGAPRQWIARFDRWGNMVWCRSYLPGVLYGITQAEDGSIVAVGEASANRRSEDYQNPGVNQWPITYNPGLTTSGELTGLDCSTSGLGQLALKNTVIKVDLNGQVVWQHFYGIPIANADGWGTGGRGWAIKAADVAGSPGFYVTASGGTGAGGPSGEHPYLIRLDADGTVVDRHVFFAGDPALGAIGVSSVGFIRPLGLDLREVGGQQRIAVSGQIGQAGVNNRAFVWYMNDADNAPFSVTTAQVTNSLQLLPHHSTSLQQHCSGVVLAEAGGSPVVIWPVLTDYIIGDVFAGRSVATLKVHRIDPPSNAITWTSNLGEVRAYDLQADGVFTSDGEVAMVSSKWSPPFNVGNPFRWDDLPSGTQACISSDFPSDWSTTENYDYWKTDAYVAKLKLSTGQLIWTATFDSDPATDHGCWPDDIRKQECMYKITEADDGGLVVSGNTSHNFDDGYLAKLKSDCQSKLAYENLPLDAFGTHVLTADQIWNTDKNIVGRLVIPAGRTLTLTGGATIRFADSEQMQWPTQLIVQPGGRLVMDAGATLSALNGACPASMWDGVQVRGNYFLGQSPSTNQGHVRMGSGATIEHARTGLLAAWGDPGDPLGAIIKESTGGLIQATDAVFRNNRYDVVFRPFENRTSQGTVIANRSSFTRCQFITQGDLNNADLHPKDHVAMAAVRGVQFRGCTFTNSIVGSTYDLPFEQGTGIHSMNSSFIVGNDCNVLLPYGTPCPPANTTSSAFTNLHRGILATTFDPSRTFSVSDATFTGTNYGIRMEGIQDAAIHRNTFEVPEPITPGIVGTVYGIYGDQCTGYSIQENAFLTTQPGGVNKKVGLVIKDSGPYYNTFYNNSFENLYTGSIIEGKNAVVDETIGLEVKCNDYGLAEANTFDVALTGSFVRVQASQGAPIFDPLDQAEWRSPAGNRFSVDHDGSGSAEEDWHVENLGTVVEYFHHVAVPPGSRTRPDWSFIPNEISPFEQAVTWPGKSIACPGRLESGGHEVKRLTAEAEHGEYGDSKDAYDATKDDGDTYSLLGYVSDPAHSSAQVRDALQSVAPKVSAEVWQAAFERSPAMSAWHITQALLSNSPLQGEVLKMMEYYALPEVYANLVYNAQSGEVNILSLLQSAMAVHGGAKSEALSDLGRLTWLDSLNFYPYLDSLLMIHGELPAWNSTLTESGVLAAKGEYNALEFLAENEALSGESPELYDLLKRYAAAEQNAGWDDAATVDLNWLAQLAAQRDLQGSAQANAWLHALGQELPEEIIILPGEGPKSMVQRHASAINWESGIALEIFPNPSTGPVFAVVEVPEEAERAELRLLDVHGRVLQLKPLSGGPNLVMLKAEGLVPGLYLAEVRLDGHGLAQAKVVIQR